MTRWLASFLLLVGVQFGTGLLDGAGASIVVTFFGLLAAAILPALSLLAANTIAPGFSVAKVKALKSKLDALISQLVDVLWMLLIAGLAVIFLQFDLPTIGQKSGWSWISKLEAMVPARFVWLPDYVATILNELPERALQAIAFTCFMLCLDRMRVVPAAFRQVLNASFELAITDSKKRLEMAAPRREEVETAFPTSSSFGERVEIVSEPDPVDQQ